MLPLLAHPKRQCERAVFLEFGDWYVLPVDSSTFSTTVDVDLPKSKGAELLAARSSGWGCLKTVSLLSSFRDNDIVPTVDSEYVFSSIVFLICSSPSVARITASLVAEFDLPSLSTGWSYSAIEPREAADLDLPKQSEDWRLSRLLVGNGLGDPGDRWMSSRT